MTARNVIQIPRADLLGQANLPVADIPEAIQLAKRIYLKRMKELLNTMFDNVDDSLFEYADKASNNQQQMVYFDAMREIRLQKQKMMEVFFIEYEKRFKQALCVNAASLEIPVNLASDSISASTLSLVEEDDLEISLAITNMALRIQTLYREALIATARRFSHLVPGIDYSSDAQPLGGTVLCESFGKAVETLTCDVPLKLIVFKLFDKFVVQRLAGAYDEVNGMFIGKGILPTIAYKSPVKSPEGKAAAASQPASDAMDTYQDDEQIIMDSLQASTAGQFVTTEEADVFGVMQQLLARHRLSVGASGVHGVPGYSGSAASGVSVSAGISSDGNAGDTNIAVSGTLAGNGNGVAGAVAGAGTYRINDIISGLSGLQNNADFTIDTQSYDAGEVNSAQAIKVRLVETLSTGNQSAAKNLSAAESDVIDIVSMMFDFILNDKSLPDKLKTLIARLQIPFIKLAILDKSFFSKKSHPARLLLNELAYSDTYFDEAEDQNDDSFYAVIEEIVKRVIEEYDSDENIFEQLLDEFVEFREQELEANRMAKEMLESTKQTVAAVIEHRVRNNKMPELIRGLLLRQWKDVMNAIGVRDSCEGIAWDAAIAVMDDLIWSVQPKLVVQEKSQLTKLIPRILNGLQDGLTLIGCRQDAIAQLFIELEILHHASVRGLCEVGYKYGITPGYNMEEFEEIILQAATNEALEMGALADVNSDSSYYYVVKGMKEGTWLTFTIDGKQKRGQLAWKCEFTGDYTFVDRKYKLVQDLTMQELLQQLESGAAVISEEVPLFDRAVNAVVNGLRQCLFNNDGKQAPAV